MAKIECIKARQIFDSHGNPTVEADVTLNDGTFARAAVPSGASTGIYEALKLKDGGSDYPGKDASKAVDNINTIIGPALVGKDSTEQAVIDNIMVQQLDGTRNEWGWRKQKVGANAILAVSLAVCKAGAAVNKIPLYKHIANLAGNSKLVLPVPAVKVISGGTLAGKKLAMQKFTILPVGASSFKEAVKMSAEVYHHLKDVIKKKYGEGSTDAGEAGGFIQENEGGLELLKIGTENAADKDVFKKKYDKCSANAGEAGGFIKENEQVLELLKKAIENADYTDKVVIGMGIATSEFYGQDKTYDMNFQEENNNGSQKIPGDALGNVYKSFVGDYAIVSFEDPFGQDDLEHYARITDEIGEHVQIVGSDLWGTNLMRAIDGKTCNALLLKVDQLGSVTESIEAVKMSKAAGWGVMASCGSLEQQRSIANRLSSMFSCFRECTIFRSGETEDPFIADLSVGLATGQIKTAAPCGSKWLAKYNRLLQIEEELGAEAVYAGEDFRKPVEPY